MRAAHLAALAGLLACACASPGAPLRPPGQPPPADQSRAEDKPSSRAAGNGDESTDTSALREPRSTDRPDPDESDRRGPRSDRRGPRDDYRGPRSAERPEGARDARSEPPQPDVAESDAKGEDSTSVAMLECRSDPLPERLRVTFDAGHTARDLAVWFATTACRRVEAPRDLLSRATLTQIDALVRRDELLELLDSLLEELELTAVERGEAVAIVPAPDRRAEREGASGDRVVLAPADDEAEREAP